MQTKTPLLTVHTIRDAKSRGKTVWTEHTHESMDLSNGTTALGIAVALGEIEMPTDADVMHDRSLFSAVASCSSGVELDQAQVVVVGNAPGVGGRYRIGHSVMKDALDARWHLGRDQGRRPGPPRATAHLRSRGPAGERLPQVRGLAGRRRARATQRDARRLRRALAPPDQGSRRRRDGRCDRRSRPCSSRSRPRTRVQTVAGRSRRSSTSAERRPRLHRHCNDSVNGAHRDQTAVLVSRHDLQDPLIGPGRCRRTRLPLGAATASDSLGSPTVA